MLDLYPMHGGERYDTNNLETDGEGAAATCPWSNDTQALTLVDLSFTDDLI